ncbi:anti-ECFsigma factor, ChrR [Kaistia soli DSM 19436]|uniref:Anti-ECFsigma factor, ChrR n=1 Tax=Kaistia soli DSM 19436 TaxID=1122133 RepID=A0A1M5NHQ1_9HYPH|nr:ChrR family anti-sigma-E factor [Kaistia soli]SHG89050.1 anti-ECFsigma factor, ChrR [Kaistia soli DSM 19436]
MSTITYKPSEETLLAYAAGTLRGPEAAVVAAHISLCPDSGRLVETLQRVGGHLIERLPPTRLGENAFRNLMARIDADGGESVVETALNEMTDLPEPLRRFPLGPWRWLGPGTRVRSVGVPKDGDCRVLLFKIDPGRRMPQHSHEGVELTCVLSGSYRDEAGRFGPGDFEEADEATDHRPMVDSDLPCLCVVALDGQIRLSGLLGRLIQPFARL